MNQIGADARLLEAPVEVKQILLAPAERADVIIDFSKLAGKSILVTNDANAPFPNGDLPDLDTTAHIMQFRVTLPLERPDPSAIPIIRFPELSVKRVRDFVIEGEEDIIRLINERPCFKECEIWRLINLSMDTHTLNLSQTQFQILDSQQFNLVKYMLKEEVVFNGPKVTPASNEIGWKDVVRANPSEITRIIVCSFC